MVNKRRDGGRFSPCPFLILTHRFDLYSNRQKAQNPTMTVEPEISPALLARAREAIRIVESLLESESFRLWSQLRIDLAFAHPPKPLPPMTRLVGDVRMMARNPSFPPENIAGLWLVRGTDGSEFLRAVLDISEAMAREEV